MPEIVKLKKRISFNVFFLERTIPVVSIKTRNDYI